MTYIGGEYSIQGLFQEVKDLVILEKIDNFNEYRELIEDMLQDKVTYGFLEPNEDVEQIRQDLELRWPEIEKLMKKRAGKLVS